MGVRTYGGVDKYLRCLKRGEDEFISRRERCESIGSGMGMRRQMRRMNRECMQKHSSSSTCRDYACGAHDSSIA